MRLWFDPSAGESAAMARSLERLGAGFEGRALDRRALREALGAPTEGLAPALRRAASDALDRAGGGGPPPAGQPGTVEEAVADGVFDLPALVHDGRVHRDLRLRALGASLGRPAPALPAAEETLPVDVYVDLADPASFVAATRAEAVCGRGVRWRPVAGASLRKGFGLTDPFREAPPLERGWWRSEIDRAAPTPLCWAGLDVRAVLATRALLQAGVDDRRGRTLLLHLLHALWVDGRDLGDRAVLEAALGEVSLDGARVLADTAPSALRDATAAAEAAGVFNTPTFVVGRRLFVGVDALEDAGRAARVVGGLVTLGRGGGTS